MSLGTCATCLYFVDWKQECRFYPPVPISEEKSVWPKVDNDDYCSGWTDARHNGRKLTFPERAVVALAEKEKKKKE